MLNQATQGVRSMAELSAWFELLPQDRRRLVLEKFAEMIQHARPFESDGTTAVEISGLKPSLTPCVVLAKGANRTQLAKLCSLPESEQGRLSSCCCSCSALSTSVGVAKSKTASNDIGGIKIWGMRQCWRKFAADIERDNSNQPIPAQMVQAASGAQAARDLIGHRDAAYPAKLI